jgi:hypothetical protein
MPREQKKKTVKKTKISQKQKVTQVVNVHVGKKSSTSKRSANGVRRTSERSDRRMPYILPSAAPIVNVTTHPMIRPQAESMATNLGHEIKQQLSDIYAHVKSGAIQPEKKEEQVIAKIPEALERFSARYNPFAESPSPTQLTPRPNEHSGHLAQTSERSEIVTPRRHSDTGGASTSRTPWLPVGVASSSKRLVAEAAPMPSPFTKYQKIKDDYPDLKFIIDKGEIKVQNPATRRFIQLKNPVAKNLMKKE